MDVESTPTLAGTLARWASSNLIRFRSGMVQKLGGWKQLIGTPLTGTGRGMHVWSDLSGDPYAAVGTDQRLQVVSAGMLNDITPYRKISTGGGAATFVTTNTSKTVTITDVANGSLAGDWVYVRSNVVVGGITLFGFYLIQTIVDADHFTITAAAAATSGASNTGTLDYLIATATASAGMYLETESGFPILTESGLEIIASGATLRQWLLDNWGAYLIGNYTNSPIFVWQPPFVAGTVAQAIGGVVNGIAATNAPTTVVASFVAMPQQIMVALGTDVQGNGVQDPNLISWSDVSDYTQWHPLATNQAGSFRIPTGSRIVGGLQTPQFAAIWTDIDMWLMQYLGAPLIFGFQKVAGSSELVAARAATTQGSTIYWMSNDSFMRYDGNGISTIPCSVWDRVFLNLNTTQIDKCWAWSNHYYNEVWWFYPSGTGTGEIDSYVKYNTLEDLWDYGMLDRVCGQDQNAYGTPMAVDTSGLLQQHEMGYDANGVAMNSFIQSGQFPLEDGTYFQVIKRVVPDFVWNAAPFSTAQSQPLITENNIPLITEQGDQIVTESTPQAVQISLLSEDFPTSTQYIYGPFTVTEATPYCITRARGRTIAINVSSNTLGVFWRFGGVRIEYAQAGKR